MIKGILDAYVVPKTWKHDRSKTIGSSEAGQCILRTWFTKNKQPDDPDFIPRWGAAERGNLFENHLWEPALRKQYGKNLKFAGKKQHTFIDGQLSATPDGLLTNAPRDILSHLGVKDIGSDHLSLECKTIDPRVNLVEARHAAYMQVQVSMGIIRAKTRYKPNYALISYANASFMDDITEFAIAFEQSVYNAAKARAATIYNAKSAQELRPEGYIKGGQECEHCPFLKSCGIQRHNLPSAKFADQPIDPQVRAEFVDMVQSANEIKKLRDKFDADYRERAEEIKDRLRDKKIRKIPGVVTWTDVKGRQAYDLPELIPECIRKGIDVEKYSKVGDATSRLTLHELPDMVSKQEREKDNGKAKQRSINKSVAKSGTAGSLR